MNDIKLNDGLLLWELETGGKNMEVIIITPTDGVDYWISIPQIKTTSETYDG